MTTPDDPEGLLSPYWYADDPVALPFETLDRIRQRERFTAAFEAAADQAKAKREANRAALEPDDD